MVRVFDDPDALGESLAGVVAEAYEGSEGSFLLGCSGGRSLLTTYRALARRGDDAWPASIVHDHGDAAIWLDRAALQ
jgi:6-phosphogluconolactonase/glucosamine-6-phosphate isomerase/deaminase